MCSCTRLMLTHSKACSHPCSGKDPLCLGPRLQCCSRGPALPNPHSVMCDGDGMLQHPVPAAERHHSRLTSPRKAPLSSTMQGWRQVCKMATSVRKACRSRCSRRYECRNLTATSVLPSRQPLNTCAETAAVRARRQSPACPGAGGSQCASNALHPSKPVSLHEHRGAPSSSADPEQRGLSSGCKTQWPTPAYMHHRAAEHMAVSAGWQGAGAREALLNERGGRPPASLLGVPELM